MFGQIFGERMEPYGQFKRVKVYYTKNGIDQHAVYMDYGINGKPSYKIIEDNANRGNRLNGEQQAIIGAMIDNEDITIIKK